MKNKLLFLLIIVTLLLASCNPWTKELLITLVPEGCDFCDELIYPPDCTNTGTKRWFCEEYNEHNDYFLTIKALGHSFPNWIPPTCEVAGNEIRSCTRTNIGCTATDTRTSGFAALEHDWDYGGGSGLINCRRPGCTATAGVGQPGPSGGVIFHVDPDGFTVQASPPGYTPGWPSYTAHYLEAAPASTIAILSWALSSDLIPNLSQNDADSTDWAIGRGRLNTAIIITHGSANSYETPAASHCAALTIGSRTDWFLPSKDELNELAQIAGQHGIPNDPVLFRSSSQQNTQNVWSHSFSGNTQTTGWKDMTGNTIAIRAF